MTPSFPKLMSIAQIRWQLRPRCPMAIPWLALGRRAARANDDAMKAYDGRAQARSSQNGTTKENPPKNFMFAHHMSAMYSSSAGPRSHRCVLLQEKKGRACRLFGS